MAKPIEKPGTPGVSKVVIDDKQCLHCGQGEDILVHTHSHRHGDLAHTHPHGHEAGHHHSDQDEGVAHEHGHDVD